MPLDKRDETRSLLVGQPRIRQRDAVGYLSEKLRSPIPGRGLRLGELRALNKVEPEAMPARVRVLRNLLEKVRGFVKVVRVKERGRALIPAVILEPVRRVV